MSDPLFLSFDVCLCVCLCVRTHKYTTFRGQSLRVRRGFQRTSASQTALNTTQLMVQLPSPVDVCGRSGLRQTVSINALLVRGVLSNNIFGSHARHPSTCAAAHAARPAARISPAHSYVTQVWTRALLRQQTCAFAAAEARLDPHFSVLTEGWCVLLLAAAAAAAAGFFFVFFSAWTTFWQPPRKDFQASTSLQPAGSPIYISQRVFALSFWAARVRVRGMLSILRNACVFQFSVSARSG